MTALVRMASLSAFVALSGCADLQGLFAPPKASVVDTFCLTAPSLRGTWSVQDTPQTIQESVAREKAIAKRCKGKP
jgi:hypothetical protein